MHAGLHETYRSQCLSKRAHCFADAGMQPQMLNACMSLVFVISMLYSVQVVCRLT